MRQHIRLAACMCTRVHFQTHELSFCSFWKYGAQRWRGPGCGREGGVGGPRSKFPKVWPFFQVLYLKWWTRFSKFTSIDPLWLHSRIDGIISSGLEGENFFFPCDYKLNIVNQFNKLKCQYTASTVFTGIWGKCLLLGANLICTWFNLTEAPTVAFKLVYMLFILV